MTLKKKSRVQEVTGISIYDTLAIKAFLQGGVYCWGNKHPDEYFSMRDLMGGKNYSWQGTPLFILYEKHICKGKSWEEAVRAAGIDSGNLLKQVIDEDKRTFEDKVEEQIRKYKWIGNEK